VHAHRYSLSYVHDEDGTNRRENITDWALEHFRRNYSDPNIAKWDIFYYVYGVLHHAEYRSRYAENLKRELPRIPLVGGTGGGMGVPPVSQQGVAGQATNHGLEGQATSHGQDAHATSAFWAFANAGRELARLHIDYETFAPYKLQYVENRDVPLSYRVEDKMRLGKDRRSLRVNDSLTLGGIPPEAFEYRLGNRSALEWVIDQYQVTEDKHSGIRSDPNRADDPE
jgi:predicted helicase